MAVVVGLGYYSMDGSVCRIGQDYRSQASRLFTGLIETANGIFFFSNFKELPHEVRSQKLAAFLL